MTPLGWVYLAIVVGGFIYAACIGVAIGRMAVKAREARHERDYTMCVWECSVCLADRERRLS